ncbi:hypothetical protein Zmor_026467 [Zophobas morio]|uniref:Ataxin-2 C-terminal domain-containing protein n=1 Tax=Zophobas morio TaxID=2755281 RepID=A0AA38M5B6_9CUCU|nr:hypothetical protein Zmor_026467 [Zophobas morio]
MRTLAQVHDGGLEENIGDSGEESEDEWNYIKGEEANKENISPTQPDCEVADLLEDQENMSQLNPNAAEFVPVSPTRSIPSPACRLVHDPVIAQSPKRPSEIDISLPNPQDFEKEVKSRPSDVDSFSNGHDHEGDQKPSTQELMENLLNGKNIDEIPEFQPGNTPSKVASSEDFHFGPNAAPFTPAKLLDQSEAALSTKAVYGDESLVNLDSTLDADSTDFAKKEDDPMSMSFYQEQGDADPFDLNKVQMLPENIDDFLSKPEEKNAPHGDAVSQDPVKDLLSDEIILNNDERIQTTDLDKVDDEKELASPVSNDDESSGVCELAKSPQPQLDEWVSKLEGVATQETLPDVCLRPESKSPVMDDLKIDTPEPQVISPAQALSPEPALSPIPQTLSPEPQGSSPAPEMVSPELQEPELCVLSKPETPVFSPEPLERPVSPEPQQILSPEPQQERVLSPELHKEPALITPELEEKPVLTPEPEDKPIVSPEPEDKPVVSSEPEDKPVVSPEPEQGSVVSPEPELRTVVSPEPQEKPILSPEREEKAVLFPELQEKSVVFPEPQEKPILSPEREEKAVLFPEPEENPILSPEPQTALSPEPQTCLLSPEPEIVAAETQILSPEPVEDVCQFRKSPLVAAASPEPIQDVCSFPKSQEPERVPTPELVETSNLESERKELVESPVDDITSSVKDVSSPIISPVPEQVTLEPEIQLNFAQEINNAVLSTVHVESSSPIRGDNQLPEVCPLSTPKSVTDTESVATTDVNSFLERSQIADLESPLSPGDATVLGHPLMKCVYPLPTEIETETITPEFAEPVVLSPAKEETPSVPSLPEETVKEPEVEPETVPVAAVAATATAAAAAAVAATAVAAEKKTTKAKTPTAAKKPAAKTTTSTTKAMASPKPAPAKAKPLTAKPTATTAKTTTAAPKTAAAKPAPKPKAPMTSTRGSLEKKPLANGDVKAPVRSSLTARTSTTKASPAKPATTASKPTPTKAAAPRPTTAPVKTATAKPASTAAPPKPRPTTLASRTTTGTVTKTTSAATTTKTTKAAVSSPKVPSPPKPRPATAPTKPRVPATRTVTKTSTDTEKQNKDSANKLTASRTVTSTRTSGVAATKTATSTVRKTESKITGTSRTTVTKTSTTTTRPGAVGKKPLEITRTGSKTTKITKIEKPVQNGVTTVVTEQITIVNNAVNDSDTQLLKDNSPIDNKLLVDTNAAD